ncbi:MAG: CHAP domain-containing protein [Erysipelotrichaceae bacterium]|nr:CHAP domain-containing protein [Erysipelotrichaceae bacterium]
MSQNNDKNSSPINGSTMVSSSLKLAKKGLKSAKKVASTALEGLAGETIICLACILGFLLLINIILSVVPSGILLKTEGDVASMESSVESAVSGAFSNAKSDSKDTVLSFLNENFVCEGKISDFKDNNDGSYALSNDFCEINVNFTPNLSQITSNVTAYTTAVNGTIDYLAPKKDMFEPEDYMFEVDEHGELSLSDYGWKVYKQNANEFNDSGSDEFAQVIKENARSFFVFDEESERWDLNDFYLGTKTKLEDRCSITYTNPTTKQTTTSSVSCSSASSYQNRANYTFHKEQVEVEVPCWYGKITIPIYYDLSSYKDDEITQTIDYVANNSNLNDFDSSSFVNSLLNDYYNNYYELLRNGEDDNRNAYFQKLIDDGVIIYVPISGLSSRFIQGEPGYDGEIFVYGMNGTFVQIWNTIGQLRREGTLSTYATRYNCTEFANYWFYCVYGEGFVLSGDGHSMVSNLLNSDYGKEHFYLGSSPAPGGIYSIGSSSSKYGHVGCVDAVDYENKTITISEGNYGGVHGTINAGIRIRKQMTFDEFYQYVNATGGGQSSWVMFANPKQ